MPLLIIDAANVMGSVPDGWWRDRYAAAERLRDRLDRASDPELAQADIVLVVEGKARGGAERRPGDGRGCAGLRR